MSEVKRYSDEDYGCLFVHPEGKWVLASDHESALATEREARRIAQEDCATLNALLDADKLIHEDLLRIRDEALAERDALLARNEALRKGLADAHHRVQWIMQYVRDIGAETISDEIAAWGQLLKDQP